MLPCLVQVLRCLASTETIIMTVRDGGPRTATSTFTDTAPELCRAWPWLSEFIAVLYLAVLQ